jgi:hypothetical protein
VTRTLHYFNLVPLDDERSIIFGAVQEDITTVPWEENPQRALRTGKWESPIISTISLGSCCKYCNLKSEI